LGVTNKIGVYLNEYVKSENINQPYKKVRSGELTYNPYRVNVGSIGVIQNEHDNFYISPAYVVFGTKEGLLNEYIYLVLSSSWFNPYLRAATSGSVRQNLTFDLLSELNVPIPPLPIQKKIVEQWHKAKKHAEELNKKADEQEKEIDDYILRELGIEKKQYEKKKGAFIAKFKNLGRWGIEFNSYSWTLDDLFASKAFPNDQLKNVAEINRTYQFTKDDLKKEVSFIPMESVSDIEGKIISTENRILDKIKNGFTRFAEGDIIFAKITPCMENGKCAIAENLTNQIGIGSTEFHVVSPNKDLIDTRYLWNILRTKIFKKSAERFFTGSAGQKRVPVNFLEDIRIPLPSLPKQKQIAEKVEKMRAEIQAMKNTADDASEIAKNKIGEMLKS